MHARSATAQAQRRTVSPFLPPDHWARPAVLRLVALGALPARAATVAWPASRAEVAAWFDAARDTAIAERDPLATRLATSFAERLAVELDSAFHRPIQARFAAGVVREHAVLLAGTMVAVDSGWRYPGPRELADVKTATLDADIAVRLNRALLLNSDVRQHGKHTEVASAYLAARFGAFDLWAGRRALSIGSAGPAGIVLNNATLDGIGVAWEVDDHVPGLRFLGPVTLDAALARTERSGSVRHPYFHAARLTVAPHDRLAIGLNRALLFGGEGNERITAARIALALIGLTDTKSKDSDFENQVASVDILWHPPLTTLVLYSELGADDSGWGFVHVPGVIVGAQLGRAGFDQLQLGAELVHLAQSCCGYPPWYQHGALGDGWTDRGRLLGHPLGGAGTEAALQWRLDVTSRALILGGRAFLRRRGAENLFAPTREGLSHGGALDLRVPWRRVDFAMIADGEVGEDGWRAGRLQMKAAISF